MSDLTANEIKKHLDCGFNFRVEVVDETDSTNTDVKSAAAENAAEGLVIVAKRQRAGRGRLNKSFYSPSGTGLYMSVLLRPLDAFTVTEYLTVFAAVAVSAAIEKVFNVDTAIKWVNDVFVGDKKCAGILTEAVTDERGNICAIVVGVGVNLNIPEGGFPDEIKDIAGCVTADKTDKRAELAAEILNQFEKKYKTFNILGAIDEYREKSNLIGKKITVTQADREYEAVVEDIDNACRLIVKRADGVTAALTYGDVKINKQQD